MLRRGYLSPTCAECGRTFDLLNPSDAEGWAYGHDCEAPEACAECSGAGYVPAIGAEDEQADGYVPCDACDGEGER